MNEPVRLPKQWRPTVNALLRSAAIAGFAFGLVAGDFLHGTVAAGDVLIVLGGLLFWLIATSYRLDFRRLDEDPRSE